MALGAAKGAQTATFAGLAGAGDTMLTANSMTSRNTSLGFELAAEERPPTCWPGASR